MGIAIYVFILTILIGVLFIVFGLFSDESPQQHEFDEYLKEQHSIDNKNADLYYRIDGYDIYIMTQLGLISISNNNMYRRIKFNDIKKIISIEDYNRKATNDGSQNITEVDKLVTGATLVKNSHSYAGIHKLGYIIEFSFENNIEKYEILVLRDSADQIAIRNAYEVYDRLGVIFKTYLANRFID
ncbi:hypothetical protein [Limosilactobacillus ingluviei]|uniref:hypothetical protein n=1 Tax=Limosilactobacillus ingluviei TaxID=148604 RepID=UPI0023F302CD|nr:hypothetical protein [Limosilactobacillus ingluviei]